MISDALERLSHAMGIVLSSGARQRCCVHLVRNLLANVPQAMRRPIAATPRTILAQLEYAYAMTRVQKASAGLRVLLP